MHALIEELIQNGPALTDGAWGTEMQARGLASGEVPDLWNLTHPDLVLAVAAAYVDAGSQIILTNTFGANAIRLGEQVKADQALEVNVRGAEISRKAAQGRAKVFGSIGPSGKILMMGEVTPEQVLAAFEEQALGLKRGGADALVIETMSDLEEAKLAVAAARTTGLPVVACMVYDSGQDKDRTMMGTTPEQAAEALTAAGADVIGANCGQGIAGFVPLCRRLRAATSLPIWIKGNAGLPKLLDDGGMIYETTPEEFAAHVPALVAAGASFIGGCCGTSPDFIRAVARRLAS